MAMQPEMLRKMSHEMRKELVSNILPFWMRYRDGVNGGFFGRVRNDGSFDSTAPKGIVQHSRLMWVYSRASRSLGERALRDTSEEAFRFIVDHFLDARRGGFYWTVDCTGKPRDELKRVYGQAFAMYALAEHARAGGSGAGACHGDLPPA